MSTAVDDCVVSLELRDRTKPWPIAFTTGMYEKQVKDDAQKISETIARIIGVPVVLNKPRKDQPPVSPGAGLSW